MPMPLRLLILPLALLLAGCATEEAGVRGPAPQVSASPAASPSATSATSASASGAASAQNAAGFARWVQGFRAQAAARGVSQATLNTAFDNVQYMPRVVALDHRQPEFNRPIWAYLDTAVSSTRVADGRAKLAEYQKTAEATTARYGVPGSIIVAIWGMESDYGADFGHFETIDALATLAYAGSRTAYAEKQLYAALKILASGAISRSEMRGSWAGAMGNTQFVPTSYLAYAVDADGNGQPNIWSSIPDTMASTANYLAQNGWQAGKPWGREVRLPPGFDYSQADGQTKKSSQAWAAEGVAPIDSRGLPDLADAGILAPAGANGPAFMVGHNYRVILRYNNATAYALGVALLSDQISGEPGVQAAWPRNEAVLSRDQTRQLQSDLNALGYSAGTPDGIMGPNTQSALRAFQKAHGLTADGFATAAVAEKVAAASH